MSDGDSEKPADPVRGQIADAASGTLQGALNTLQAAAVERDRLLDQFRDQKERLDFQLQRQREQAMHYVEQTRAATQERTGGPSGHPAEGNAAESSEALKLTPDQQFIAGIKMLIYQDTRPYLVTTENQTQAALLLLDALKKTIHQEINVLFERAQAQEVARQESEKQASAANGTEANAPPPAPDPTTPAPADPVPPADAPPATEAASGDTAAAAAKEPDAALPDEGSADPKE